MDLFQQQDVIPGIKVDQGVEPLSGGLAGESCCTGLNDLAERAARTVPSGVLAILFLSGGLSELSGDSDHWTNADVA